MSTIDVLVRVVVWVTLSAWWFGCCLTGYSAAAHDLYMVRIRRAPRWVNVLACLVASPAWPFLYAHRGGDKFFQEEP